MPAGQPLEASLIEAEFLHASLKASLRPDGRTPLQPLPLRIHLGPAQGSATVVQGTTRVLAFTSAQLVAPRTDRPYEGSLEIKAEVQPMAGAQFERGRTNEEQVLFERGLDRALRRSEAVDREALCVVAGQKVWAITLHVHLLSSGGALTSLDAAILASLLSLRHFRRPDATVEGGPPPRRSKGRGAASTTTAPLAHRDRARVVLHDPSERVAIPLALHHTPFSVSLAVFNIDSSSSSASTGESEEVLLLDASPLEAELAHAVIHVVCTPQGEVCTLDKAGGAPLKVETVEKAVALARRRVKELAERVERELDEDAKRHVVEVR